jgi:hypothetical protein
MDIINKIKYGVIVVEYNKRAKSKYPYVFEWIEGKKLLACTADWGFNSLDDFVSFYNEVISSQQ